MNDDRPAWARRIRQERLARNWTQLQGVQALRAHAGEGAPSVDAVLRRWKAWEKGEGKPDSYYGPLVAKTFGTVTDAFFPQPSRRNGDEEIAAVSGMETLEIVTRLQRSDIDNAVLDALRITADRLCSEYPYMPSEQLLVEGRAWLRRVIDLRDKRMTFAQHRELLVLAGWIALLVGCVEYDTGNRQAAETTRRAALSLGMETGNVDVAGWAHEMQAWFSLTRGDYHSVVRASQNGLEIAKNHSVSVQLAAQEAKAWARIGDRRQMEVALERGRKILEDMPYPDNLDNHFVVDPAKFDFYTMDCYRIIGENPMATNLAEAVIQASVDFDGTERVPMRVTEARITLGVVAAREGDVDEAVNLGVRALATPRKSLPSLIMVSRELAAILRDRYQDDPTASEYLTHLRDLAKGSK